MYCIESSLIDGTTVEYNCYNSVPYYIYRLVLLFPLERPNNPETFSNWTKPFPSFVEAPAFYVFDVLSLLLPLVFFKNNKRRRRRSIHSIVNNGVCMSDIFFVLVKTLCQIELFWGGND